MSWLSASPLRLFRTPFRAWPRGPALAVAGLALKCWRRLRPRERRSDSRGQLLGVHRHQTVLLIWLLDVSKPEEILRNQTALMGIFDRVVIVTDNWELPLPDHPACQMEIVPDRDSQARFAADADWPMWFERRCATLRHDWAPDFEINLGTAPDKWLSRGAAAVIAGSPAPVIT